ncbi:MAG: GyrI-like domain-containing protein [Gillisia sp.]|nr:GyrI-like domain-containing protein [Gillisia sp.]
MKKIISISLVVAIIAAVWYLFIKEYDYQFRFEAKYGPATVYQEILNWENFTNTDDHKNIKVIEKEPYSGLVQQVDLANKNSLLMEWEFEYINDSVTQVIVNTLDKEDQFKNRLEILNPFEKSGHFAKLKENFSALNKRLNARQEAYKITMADTATSPAFDCACITSKAKVENKANAMMATVKTIESYLLENELTLQGSPFLKVTQWDIDKNIIIFDFCYPVQFNDSLKETGEIQLKHIESSKSLFAVFNGNYRQSHLAWLDLYEKARRENIVINPLPLEVYIDNPMTGKESIDWRADIYLPLQ